jgi:hypothetical protein
MGKVRKISWAVVLINVGVFGWLVVAHFTGWLTPVRLLMTVGGLSQFDGVYLVLPEISATERLLDLPPWLASMASEFAGELAGLLSSIRGRFGKRRARQTQLRGASLGMAGSLAARVRVIPGSIADQLAALRDELDRVQGRLDQHEAEQGQELTALRANLRAEIAEVHRLVTELTAGFRRQRAVGVVLILCGAALIIVGAWV